MYVSLTWRQLAACRYWATPRQLELLDQAESVRKHLEVAMPFAAWRALSRRMQEEAFTRWGRGRPSKMTGSMAGTRSAIHTIERRLSDLEVHPALRGQAVMGCSGEHLVVWPSRQEQKIWQLTSAVGTSMRVLTPRFDDTLVATSIGSTFRPKITWWVPVSPDSLTVNVPFLDEADHVGW